MKTINPTSRRRANDALKALANDPEAFTLVEKIRKHLAVEEQLGDEHYCGRCGAAFDLPLRRPTIQLCSTCNGELDRGMWSGVEKYTIEQTEST